MTLRKRPTGSRFQIPFKREGDLRFASPHLLKLPPTPQVPGPRCPRRPVRSHRQGSAKAPWVYRARDSTLSRDVALKILPEAFATHSERLARFKREAQVLASLNHPNIATIYGSEDGGAVHALVITEMLGQLVVSSRS